MNRSLASHQLEEELDVDILKGDAKGEILTQEAFGQLYDNYFPRLYNYVSYRVSSREEAEDFVALIFERVLAKYATFDPRRGSFDNWIFSIARNALANHWRGLRRHPHTSLEQANNALDIFEDNEAFAPTESFLKNEELERLRRYLQRLNSRERDLIALRYGAGLNQRRVGEILGMKETNVAVALGRIVKKLRQWFEQED